MNAEWSRALRALALLAVDPDGLRGTAIHARAGPVRRAFEDLLGLLPGPRRRLHPGVTDDQMFGGLDLAATLAEGRAVRGRGVADGPATLVLPMAERCPPGLAARLSQLLDGAGGHSLLLLDESAEDEPGAPASLTDRVAFALSLDNVRQAETAPSLPAPADLDAARKRLTHVALRPEDAGRLTALAATFGIASLRAPLFALRAARAIAALDNRAVTNDPDLLEAAELVYPARATVLPEAPPETQVEPPKPETPGHHGEGGDTEIPDDMLVAAIAAHLPDGLLRRLESGSARTPGTGSGAGAPRKGNRRGRPLPARRGRPGSGTRIDVAATLRAAAPWQPLRRQYRHGGDERPIILPDDIRLARFEDRSDRLLLFTVDASGSAALARLAETKGAVELLLGEAYARRDQVAVIAFRGQEATLLLPPTRSLVQAKRRLSALPGGGGTPLAAALLEALALVRRAGGQGLSPAIALLTDGRANVALDGSGDRARALEDAERIARHLAALRVPGLVIDTSPRGTPGDPQPRGGPRRAPSRPAPGRQPPDVPRGFRRAGGVTRDGPGARPPELAAGGPLALPPVRAARPARPGVGHRTDTPLPPRRRRLEPYLARRDPRTGPALALHRDRPAWPGLHPRRDAPAQQP